jgi:hypothetical protein
MPNGVFTYAVTRTIIVKPDDLWVIYPTSTRTMTLFACHPKHEKTHRIVVTGQLVSAQRKAPPPAPAAPAQAPPPPPSPPAPAAPSSPPPPATTPTTEPPQSDGRCNSWICLFGR